MRGRINLEAAAAVKVAWQEESRVSEQQIFDEINRVAKALGLPFHSAPA